MRVAFEAPVEGGAVPSTPPDRLVGGPEPRQRRFLTRQQGEAVKQIEGLLPGSVAVIMGEAGSGKSEVCNYLLRDPRVLLVTQTHMATAQYPSQLRATGQVDTLSNFLGQPNALSGEELNLRAACVGPGHKALRRRTNPPRLVIVDEVFQVPLYLMQLLLLAMHGSGASLLLVGDPRQCGAVGPSPLAALRPTMQLGERLSARPVTFLVLTGSERMGARDSPAAQALRAGRLHPDLAAELQRPVAADATIHVHFFATNRQCAEALDQLPQPGLAVEYVAYVRAEVDGLVPPLPASVTLVTGTLVVTVGRAYGLCVADGALVTIVPGSYGEVTGFCTKADARDLIVDDDVASLLAATNLPDDAPLPEVCFAVGGAVLVLPAVSTTKDGQRKQVVIHNHGMPLRRVGERDPDTGLCVRIGTPDSAQGATFGPTTAVIVHVGERATHTRMRRDQFQVATSRCPLAQVTLFEDDRDLADLVGLPRGTLTELLVLLEEAEPRQRTVLRDVLLHEQRAQARRELLADPAAEPSGDPQAPPTKIVLMRLGDYLYVPFPSTAMLMPYGPVPAGFGALPHHAPLVFTLHGFLVRAAPLEDAYLTALWHREDKGYLRLFPKMYVLALMRWLGPHVERRALTVLRPPVPNRRRRKPAARGRPAKRAAGSSTDPAEDADDPLNLEAELASDDNPATRAEAGDPHALHLCRGRSSIVHTNPVYGGDACEGCQDARCRAGHQGLVPFEDFLRTEIFPLTNTEQRLALYPLTNVHMAGLEVMPALAQTGLMFYQDLRGAAPCTTEPGVAMLWWMAHTGLLSSIAVGGVIIPVAVTGLLAAVTPVEVAVCCNALSACRDAAPLPWRGTPEQLRQAGITVLPNGRWCLSVVVRLRALLENSIVRFGGDAAWGTALQQCAVAKTFQLFGEEATGTTLIFAKKGAREVLPREGAGYRLYAAASTPLFALEKFLRSNEIESSLFFADESVSPTRPVPAPVSVFSLCTVLAEQPA
jgi:hypothetical protein